MIQKTTHLPENANCNTVYELTPNQADDAYYIERTDRNIGWITREEQQLLKNATVGISGCGGMGGLLAQTLLRVGVGHLKIADIEEFDASNINRQFAARRETIGKNKAFETAKSLRAITDDTTITVYSRGINEEDVDAFLEGCDIVCDEIEFWAVAARILLHERARAKSIEVFNSNTVGFGTRLFRFTPTSGTMEECLGLGYDQAKALQAKIENDTATEEEIQAVMNAVTRGLIPDLPEYTDVQAPTGNKRVGLERLEKEGKAPIFGCNPVMAAGFIADHIVLRLLDIKGTTIQRHTVTPPPMPGYLYFDAGFMEAKVVNESWYSEKAAS